MSTHNIGFYEDLTKIIFELSSNIIKYAPYFFYSFHVMGSNGTVERCRGQWFNCVIFTDQRINSVMSPQEVTMTLLTVGHQWE